MDYIFEISEESRDFCRYRQFSALSDRCRGPESGACTPHLGPSDRTVEW